MSEVPRATYRLQLRPGFGFDEAAEVAPYLAALGISHVYCSPYLQAAPGSTHGYDIADPTCVNDELGGPDAHARFLEALKANGLGQVLDIVPNHMTNKGRANRWWWDLLEHGHDSRYTPYFDLNWHPRDPKLLGKVLLPFLGDHYGRLLEQGDIRLGREGGRFVVKYGEHEMPVSPRSIDALLSSAADRVGSSALLEAATAVRGIQADPEDPERLYGEVEALVARLETLMIEDPDVAEAVDAVVAEWNASPEPLDGLLSRQNYRLSFWRTGSGEINYRRFFVENALVGMCVENDRVFGALHGRVLQWVREGAVTGLRVDHIDGLRDPDSYLQRLREQARDSWIVVEKILDPGERMPEGWPIQGTTGYEFLNTLLGLFVDPAGEEPLTAAYSEFTGRSLAYVEQVREKKLLVLRSGLASEVNRLTLLLLGISEKHWRYRDYTIAELADVLRELIACFPVYRTYTRPETSRVGEQDENYIRQAAERAKEFRPDVDPQVFNFVRDLLLLRMRGEHEDDFVLRFQQLSGPAMAKGVEDTLFYSYNRMVALNEVGGSPERFGISPEEFHAHLGFLHSTWPHTMTATSTHDTKRSEGVRARLVLLSEMPERWAEAVRRWSGLNERHRHDEVPSRNDEYLFYQTLVGAWPLETYRAVEYMQKALREAKEHTDWVEPRPEYEEPTLEFVKACLEDEEFRRDLEAFVQPLVWPGRINALAQVALKLASPGVPDTYQGTELWDLSLVDPDNRRPVDYDRRRTLLAELEELSPEAVLERADDGLPKLWLLKRGLDLRARRPEAFGDTAAYEPLSPRGAKAPHAVAFARGRQVIAAVPRLFLGLDGQWQDTVLDLPAGTWRHVLTHESFDGGPLPLDRLFRRFPVALLERMET